MLTLPVLGIKKMLIIQKMSYHVQEMESLGPAPSKCDNLYALLPSEIMVSTNPDEKVIASKQWKGIG